MAIVSKVIDGKRVNVEVPDEEIFVNMPTPYVDPIESIEKLFGVMPIESQKKFDPFVTSGFFYLSKNNPAMVAEKYKEALALHDPSVKEEVVFIDAVTQLLGAR